jgi:flavin reductase (DIM6/NTAB) family NADH-FMN oxidoreductase RutF
MTVSFFSEVAHHPTSLWVSVAPSCYTHELLEAARRFTFVTLHRGQARLAAECGTISGRELDKCASLDLYEGGDGYLYLRGALASTACRVTRSVPLGDHTLFIAEMLSGDIHRGGAALRNLLLSDVRAL